MTNEQKARKVAEELACKALSRHTHTDGMINAVANALLQFHQEQESEAVGELVDIAKRMRESFGHDHWDDTMQRGLGCRRCIAQRELSEEAAARIAKHSRKGQP